MRELNVKAMRRRLTREEFAWWMVAYHELHLDGSGPAALVANEVHNALTPLWTQIGLEWPQTQIKDHLPTVLIGDEATDEDEADEPDNTDQMLAIAEKLWG